MSLAYDDVQSNTLQKLQMHKVKPARKLGSIEAMKYAHVKFRLEHKDHGPDWRKNVFSDEVGMVVGRGKEAYVSGGMLKKDTLRLLMETLEGSIRIHALVAMSARSAA